MNLEDIKEKNLPDRPGVYMFCRGREVLYVGKAASLVDRVRSYFSSHAINSRGVKIQHLMETANRVDWQETDSVLEALMLESVLIKQYQPRYNTREKDDKSFWQVIITKELYPRVLPVRSKQLAGDWDPDDIQEVFGPFPNAKELKVALKLIRRIFPFRDKCTPDQGRPCFDHQLGLCPGVCVGGVDVRVYNRTIGQLKLFFRGKRQALKKTLDRQMKQAAKSGRFEEAAVIRDRVWALQHVQDVALLTRDELKTGERIEAYDVAHLSGSNTVGAMAVVIGGQPTKEEYRRFNIKEIKAGEINDPRSVAEILFRRSKHSEWQAPDLVVVDGGVAQIRAAERVLKGKDLSWPVVGVVKDDRHKPKDIINSQGTSLAATGKMEPAKQTSVLLAASEVHRFALSFHRKKRKNML